MKRKFWNWVRNEADGERTLVLNGEISDETWYGDEVTPALFQRSWMQGRGILRSGSILRAGMCLRRRGFITC